MLLWRYNLDCSLAKVGDHHHQATAQKVEQKKADRGRAGGPVLDVVEDLVRVFGAPNVPVVIPMNLPAHVESRPEHRRQDGAHRLVCAWRGKQQVMHRLVLEDVTRLTARAYEDESQDIGPPSADVPGDHPGA